MNNKGIIDIQLYFPRYFVDQNELETYDDVGKGKYTIGLGQEKMAFTSDREDINSICLTVLDKIMQRNKINPKDIGRLEVGTETFVDKSKSIKTYLMEFFRGQNFDIEGISTTNACYGGTNALFNAVNWLNSDYYDGRYAIVICADIAVYAKGRARPTGGCGSVAILLGRGASINIEKVRSTYMNHVYDFYKPDPASEYPVVDGVFSLDCYFKALEVCYETYLNKGGKSLDNIDYFCFHSPFSKMVEKAFIQLVSYDIYFNKDNLKNSNLYKSKTELIDIFHKRERNFKLKNEEINLIKKYFSEDIKNKVLPSLYLGKNLGNIYTGSLYIGLISLILNKDIDLLNKRISMFSYGSGCAASLFTIKVESIDYLRIRENNFDVIDNLNNRLKFTPKEYENILNRKEKLYVSKNFVCEDNINNLFDGTYYLDKIDEKWRRYYLQKGGNQRKIEFNKLKNKSLNRLNMIRNHLFQNMILPKNILFYDNIITDRIEWK